MFVKKPNFFILLFLIITPLLGIGGTLIVCYYSGFHLATLFLSVIYLFISGVAITAGYHRLFAHAAYKTARPIRLIYLLLGAAACEGSALRWAADHRNHHRYTDQDNDPYGVSQGFWHAHMGWFIKQSKEVDYKNVADLTQDSLINWQHRYYIVIAGFMGFLLPALIAAYWGDFWGGLLMAGCLRVAVNQHLLFLLNSACHYFGKQPYLNITARDNAWLSLLTYGEGFHNFHHQFAADYRNGIRWYHFDPPKWLIWGLAKVNLAHHLKRVDDEFIIKRRLHLEEQDLRNRPGVVAHQLDEVLKPLLDKLHHLHSELLKLRKEYSLLKAKKLENENLQYNSLTEYTNHITRCRKEFAYIVKQWAQAKKSL